MILTHPNILEKEGKKEFVVFPYEDFLKIQEELEDYEDLKALREVRAKEGDAETISFEDAKKMFGIK